jgi:hypothetical protein
VQLLVAASDYQSSVVCGAPGCYEVAGKTTGVDLGKDPILASSNGRAFFVARDEDVVFELDPGCGTSKGRTDLSSFKFTDAAGVKRSANPHDVAAADDGTLVVALYTNPKLVFAPPSGPVGSVDLAPYDDYDHNPQAESVRIVNGKAFVALERLDDLDKTNPTSGPILQSVRASQMLVVDVASRTPVGTTDLAGKNPFNAMSQLGTSLFLAEPDSTDKADDEFGGIERFETTTLATKLLVHEKDIGASVMEIAVRDGCGVAIVAGAVPQVNPTALVTFDPDSGAVLHSFAQPVLGPTTGFDLQGLTWRGDTLYVGDRRKAANGFYPVHELALSGRCDLTETTSAIDLPQAPVGIQAAK